jgi:hypothetical protein
LTGRGSSAARLPDFGSDLASLPGVLAGRWMWIPFAMLVVAFLLVLMLDAGALPAGALEDMAGLYISLTLPPTSLIVFIIGGVLATRASYLVGALLGAFDALLYTLLFIIVPDAFSDAQLEEAGLSSGSAAESLSLATLAPLWVIAVLVGMVVAGIAGLLKAVIRERASHKPRTDGDDAHSLEFGGQPASMSVPEVASRPRTLIRTYRGRQQHDAVEAFRRDAEQLAAVGYAPTSQSWAPGQWGWGAFLVAVLLFLVLIGILVFIYMLVVKPDGTLTLTYQLVEPAPVPVMSAPTSTLPARLAELDEARRAGLITETEYRTKRTALLDQH